MLKIKMVFKGILFQKEPGELYFWMLARTIWIQTYILLWMIALYDRTCYQNLVLIQEPINNHVFII